MRNDSSPSVSSSLPSSWRSPSLSSSSGNSNDPNEEHTLVMLHNSSLRDHNTNNTSPAESEDGENCAVAGRRNNSSSADDDGSDDKEESPGKKSTSDESRTSSVQTRRTSFRHTMLQQQRQGRLGVGTRTSLKEVVQAAKQQSLRDDQQHQDGQKHQNDNEEEQCHLQEANATTIQAAFRDYGTRHRIDTNRKKFTRSDETTIPAYHLTSSPSPHQTSTTRSSRFRPGDRPSPDPQRSNRSSEHRKRFTGSQYHHLRTDASEITMSDFDGSSLFGDDSFHSLGSRLSLSPRTKMRRNNDEKQPPSTDLGSCDKLQQRYFQNSTLTDTTADPTDYSESELNHQASFSSVFSSAEASLDVPIKMPFRKSTPSRSEITSIDRSSDTSAVAAPHNSDLSSESWSRRTESQLVTRRATFRIPTCPSLPIPDVPSRASISWEEDNAEVAIATSRTMTDDTTTKRFDVSISSVGQLRPRKTTQEEWETTIESLHLSLTGGSFDLDEPPMYPARRTLYPLVVPPSGSAVPSTTSMENSVPTTNPPSSGTAGETIHE